MRPEPETATLHGTRSAHMLFSVWHVSGPELQGMWWPLGKHGRAQHVMLPNSVHHRQFNLMAARVALLLANTNSWLLSWLPAQMARASTVRVVLFDQSPFAAQWNDQVMSPRREDWREFMDEQVQVQKQQLPPIQVPVHFTILAMTTLQFLVVILPGADPSMG